MKNHFKKSLKYLILFITVMLSSCDKDQYEDSSQAQPKYNFTVKEVSLSSLSADDKLLKTVAQIKPKKQNVNGKIIYDPVNNFYFDDTSGKEIITPEGYKSYTFQIISDDDSSQVENVLFTQKENGEYDAYRVKYDFTDEELKRMTKEDIATQKASYTFITSSKPNFTSKTTITCWSIEVWEDYFYSGDQGNNDGSIGSTYQGGWVSVAKVCSESNTEIETENNSDNTGWGTGTFSGNATPIQGNSIYTSPVVTPGSTFIKTIQPKILRSDFFQLSEKAHELTFNYLTLHNFDQISQSKVRGALLKLNVLGLSELPPETHIGIFDNLIKNDFSNESITFGNYIISLGYMGLQLDIPASFKSPMNIDRTSIDNNTDEGKKINSVYDALTKSPEFKKLFVDMFGNSTRFNVKFELVDALYDDKDPTKEINGNTTYDPNLSYILIKINKKKLNDSSIKQTRIENARTIIHEFIHAYLFTITSNPIVGPTDIASLLNKKYPNATEQHDFMYNNMIPTITKILTESRDFLTYPAGRIEVESLTVYTKKDQSTSEIWNWKHYFESISMEGLSEATSYKTDFPAGSDTLNKLELYVKYGRTWLDKKN